MTETVDLTPQQLDLKLYSGDGVRLPVTITDKNDDPVDLTTGTIKVQIRLKRGIDTPAEAEFSVDLTDGVDGVAIISLTGTQTHDLAPVKNFKGVWDFQWTASGAQPRTLIQGKVECDVDVTR